MSEQGSDVEDGVLFVITAHTDGLVTMKALNGDDEERTLQAMVRTIRNLADAIERGAAKPLFNADGTPRL